MYSGWRNSYLRYKTYFLNVVGRYREREDIRAYLEILLSLTAVSIFSVFALRPTLLTIAELIREIETKKETLSQMEAKIKNLSQAQALFDKERVAISLLNTSIPQRVDPVVFSRQIEGLSSKHQVELTQIETGSTTLLGKDTISSSEKPPTTGKTIVPLPEGTKAFNYSIGLTSRPDQFALLMNFLSDLERLRLPSRLDYISLSITKIKEEKTLSMKIEARIPFYADKEE